MSLDVLSAFVIGLLGSGHCLAMCGGITTMLTNAVTTPPNYQQANKQSPGNIPVRQVTETTTCSPQYSRFSLVLFYHVGRITCYTLMGAIVGLTGSLAAKSLGFPMTGLRVIAALFLILLGLYIGQWLFWLNHIESVGQKWWRYLSPLAKYVIPVNSPAQALGLGGLWGWLPCGLVYSTLTWSLASGSLLNGGAIMLCFGLGTLPALLALSLGLGNIKKYIAQPIFRKVMALNLIGYGIYSLVKLFF